jgi:copper transport protein
MIMRTRARSSGRPGLLAAALLMLLALLPQPAAAHAVLVEAAPANGARVETAPAELRLRFNEAVRPVALRLLDGGGREVANLAVEAAGAALTLRPATPLPPGTYFLSYRVTSLDGHPVAATLRFGVGVDPELPAEPERAERPAFASALGRLLAYLGALGAAGLTLFLRLVDPPAALALRVMRWIRALALAGAAAVLLRLGLGGLDLAGLPPAALLGSAPWLLAAGTSQGAAAGLALAALLLLAMLPDKRSRAALAAAVLVGASFALTGHAAAAAPRWLTMPAVAAHVLCGGFWLASLLPLLWALRLPAADAAALLRRFGQVATGAVGLLLLAGLGLAWVQLGGHVDALAEPGYGQRLLAKLSLVAGLLALAAFNRWRLVPALAGAAPGPGRLRATLAADLLLGLGVLALTASLGLGPPPRAQAPPGTEAAEPGITVLLAARGQVATVTLLPGRPGANRLLATVADPAGAPLAAQAASVILALPAAGLEPARYPLAMARPGVYQDDALLLPRAGRWQLRLELLIDDFTKLTFAGDLVLPAP